MSSEQTVRALCLGLVVVAMGCSGVSPAGADAGDSGAVADAGGGLDGGFDAGLDAGMPDAGPVDAGPDPLIVARPYGLTVPPAYDGGTALPLVVLLHGYSADAVTQDAYFGLSTLARQRGFFVALPDGTRNASLTRFWNATDACCAFGETVDDVAWLTAVIDDVARLYRVDPKRVFLLGHSNGGFMSHRMACDRSSRIAAIASLAGAVWQDSSKCQPTEPVSVLQVHGTLDAVIAYLGGANAGIIYPGAATTMRTWAQKNGCTASTPSTGATLDLEGTILGSETTSEAYAGCPAGGAVELWSIQGGSHVPTFSGTGMGLMVDWLFAHPKP